MELTNCLTVLIHSTWLKALFYHSKWWQMLHALSVHIDLRAEHCLCELSVFTIVFVYRSKYEVLLSTWKSPLFVPDHSFLKHERVIGEQSTWVKSTWVTSTWVKSNQLESHQLESNQINLSQINLSQINSSQTTRVKLNQLESTNSSRSTQVNQLESINSSQTNLSQINSSQVKPTWIKSTRVSWLFE